jgi:hypothetical protein
MYFTALCEAVKLFRGLEVTIQEIVSLEAEPNMQEMNSMSRFPAFTGGQVLPKRLPIHRTYIILLSQPSKTTTIGSWMVCQLTVISMRLTYPLFACPRFGECIREGRPKPCIVVKKGRYLV